jgi:hypothetical protein
MQNPTKRVGLTCSRHDIAEQNDELVLNNNHSHTALKIGLCSSNYHTTMFTTIMQFTEKSMIKRNYS